jgi:hypothetical protein
MGISCSEGLLQGTDYKQLPHQYKRSPTGRLQAVFRLKLMRDNTKVNRRLGGRQEESFGGGDLES